MNTENKAIEPKKTRTSWHVVSPLIMWICVIVGVSAFLWLMPETLIFSAYWLSRIIFLAVFLIWLVFFRGAMKVHKQAALSVAGIDKLITEGIYRYLRHPLYTGDILLMWGIFFLMPEVRILIGAIWVTGVLIGWMLLEEKFLLEKFGEEYEEYKKRTPMIVPKIV